MHPDRHEVAVLALPHVVAFELGLPHRFLGGAVDDDGRPLYTVRTCTVDGGPIRTSAHYSVLPEHDASILRTARTIVVPGIVGGPPVVEGRLEPAVAASLAGRRPDARLVSICTGAYVLAAAGVLDGRPATTHWMRTRHFLAAYPKAKLEPDQIFIRDGNIWSSAGITAGIDLALALVAEDYGDDIVEKTARQLVLYHRRSGGQSQFSSLLELKAPTGRFGPLLTWAREHLDAPLTVEDLAERAGMSSRHFTRAFIAETGTTPSKAIERLRIEVARARVQSSNEAIERVAETSGFRDPERMRRAFIRAFGQPPQALRRAARAG